MSIARHHADWLSLIEVSGPFVSLPVVQRAFPHGLPDLESGLISEVRAAYADLQDNGSTAAATHAAWVQYVLQRILGFPPDLIASGQTLPPGLEARVDTFHETLRPDFAILPPMDRATRRPALLVRVYPPQQRLESPLMGVVWKASPAARMMELLHATDLPLGLVTNGEEWQLVFAPKNESTGFASWFADLWLQEPVTLRAFQALLGQHRFFGVADDDTPAALLRASLKDQHEVTDSLGAQVRQAVELLVRDFDRLDIESNRTLLAGLKEAEIYNASLTVMMRLVFLFCAEEKGLLRLGEDFYDSHYAVSTLRQQLREVADQRGEEVLERRSDAWCRLLATFRAVHGGVEHDAMRLPAYGGTLFDPDRYPFLEGRAAGTQWRSAPSQPPHINNRVVLHLLEALQILRTKLPGGGPAEARRLSFRSLDIEQIGHVYEGLLDHTARRATAITVGLEGSSKAPAPLIPLATLEALAAKGNDALLDELEELTGRSRTALEKALGLRAATGRGKKKAAAETEASPSLIPAPSSLIDEHQLAVACGHDPRLVARVLPFAGLMRRDSFDQLVLVQEDSLHVAPGSERRSTGTHYTPRTLTEPIVLHTLEPLVYTGPAEGLPQGEWKLKSPKELLALKVCDMAMGSGAFLVQTCRYLAERLVEAWDEAENSLAPNDETDKPAPQASESDFTLHHSSFIILPDGSLSRGSAAERLLPNDPAERIALARRYVADRCLYGVDINPMAVEMAKLSLWLITLQRDRPFTFLDHALKCGDSLLGVSKTKQIENFTLRTDQSEYSSIPFAVLNLFRYVEEASSKRRALEDLPSNDHTQIATKNRLHAEAEAATAKVKALADCLIALELRGLDGEAYENARDAESAKVQSLMARDADASLKSPLPLPHSQSALASHASEQLRGRRPFHWAVEFPEVFAHGGFDGFVGNPPFLGGVRVSELYGVEYNNHLARTNPPASKKSDLATYFMRRAEEILGSERGCAGLVTTKTLAQGNSRRAGLDVLVSNGVTIYHADTAFQWPGDAAVLVCIIHFTRGPWKGACYLDGQHCPYVDGGLRSNSRQDVMPAELPSSHGMAYQGACLYGMGFLLTPERMGQIISGTTHASEVITPYLGGEDVNQMVDLIPNRYVVNFGERTEDEARCFGGAWEHLEKHVLPERMTKDLTAYPRLREWWKYWHSRQALFDRIRGMKRVIVCARVSKRLMLRFAPATWTFNDKVIVIARDTYGEFAALQSTLHEEWAWKYGSTLKADLNYVAKACHASFPFPENIGQLDLIGETYNGMRAAIMGANQEGLTTTYNRFHDRGEQSADIARLRELHVEMDQAVAAAYGWSDLDLGHGFHATKQGERYTLSEPARRIVLDLNHQRYEEELKAGLHDKKKLKPKTALAKKQVKSTGAERQLPDDMRLPAAEAPLYTANLILSLLSEAGGGLKMSELAGAFYLVTNPTLMIQKAKGAEKELARAWASRWNEPASPEWLLPTLRIMGPGNISADSDTDDDPLLELLDGPKPHAHDDLAYDAWLALRVMRLGKSSIIEPEKWQELSHAKKTLFAMT